jgi:hypothetical protein
MTPRTRSLRLAAALACSFTVLTVSGAAFAAGEKTTQTEAVWISFDPAAKTVKVKVDKSKGPNKDKLKKNEEVSFRVVPEGSVLKRTSVAINGVKGELTDIQEGKRVNVYWLPDPENASGYFARKIDVTLSEEELNKRYPDAE